MRRGEQLEEVPRIRLDVDGVPGDASRCWTATTSARGPRPRADSDVPLRARLAQVEALLDP